MNTLMINFQNSYYFCEIIMFPYLKAYRDISCIWSWRTSGRSAWSGFVARGLSRRLGSWMWWTGLMFCRLFMFWCPGIRSLFTWLWTPACWVLILWLGFTIRRHATRWSRSRTWCHGVLFPRPWFPIVQNTIIFRWCRTVRLMLFTFLVGCGKWFAWPLLCILHIRLYTGSRRRSNTR